MGKQRQFVKRQATRVRVGAKAFALRHDGCIGPLLVNNLSAGGALLIGGAPWRIGETFVLELQLDEGPALRTSALVLRQEERREGLAVAVQFQDPSADVEDAIQDAVMASIERSLADAATAIVVVSPLPHDVEAIASAISKSGATPLVVTTFLDALRWLQDPRVVVRALVVDADAESGVGVEAMQWCAEEFPAVRCVLLLPEMARADGRKPSRHGQYSIVASPVTPRRLAKALGRVSARRRVPRQLSRRLQGLGARR